MTCSIRPRASKRIAEPAVRNFYTFILKLISKLIMIVISAPLFNKSNFIYKYPPTLLVMYTGISTPLILEGTLILRKCNSHTLTVIQEKQCCYATIRCSKTSQSQALNFSSFRDRNGSLSTTAQIHRKLQSPDNCKACARGFSTAKRGIPYLQMRACRHLGNP